MFFKIFKILFLIVWFFFVFCFVSTLWSKISSYRFLHAWFFHTIFFKGKFYIDSGSRLPFANLFDGLAENFPKEKILQLKYLIRCNSFLCTQVNNYNWSSSVVVRRPSCINSCCLKTTRLIAIIFFVKHIHG